MMIPKLKKQPEAYVRDVYEEKGKKAALGLTEEIIRHPMAFYVPPPPQEEFINTVKWSMEDTNMPIVLWTAANGVGKTTTSVETILNIVLDTGNPYFQGGVFEKFNLDKKIWYCSTGEAIKDTIIPQFLKRLEHKNYRTKKRGKPWVDKIIINGWEIIFKTYDQSPDTYESANVGIIWCDEPAPQNIWKAIKSRRRLGCMIVLVMTPLFCPPYVFDEVQSAIDDGDGNYFKVRSDIYSVAIERDPRGFMKTNEIKTLVKGYDAEEREAREKGLFAYFQTRIFKNLDRDKHIVKSYPIPPGSVFKQIVDPHDGRPPAVIWLAETPKGRIIVFAEYPLDQKRMFWDMNQPIPIKQQIEDFISIENELNLMSPRRVIDRRFGFQTRRGKTIAHDYAAIGRRICQKQFLNKSFIYNKSYSTAGLKDNELQYRHNRIRDLLQPMDDGKAGILIEEKCYHTWTGLTHYIRKHETTKSAEDRPAATGKIVEKYKDFADVVGYGSCDQHVQPKRSSQPGAILTDNPLNGL